jgi:hypothetical protein
MRLRFLAVLALLATPLFANTPLFTKYEAIRQGLIKKSMKDVQAGAKQLAAAAREAKNEKVAKYAEAVAKSADITAAREAF